MREWMGEGEQGNEEGEEGEGGVVAPPWAIFLNVPKIQVSGRYQPQKVWVGPSRKQRLDFLNDIEIGTGRPQEFGDGPKILQGKPYAYLSVIPPDMPLKLHLNNAVTFS